VGSSSPVGSEPLGMWGLIRVFTSMLGRAAVGGLWRLMSLVEDISGV